MTLDDANIRAALHTSLKAAWADLVKVHDDAPMVPGSASDLPRAFVELADIEPVRNGAGAGARDVALVHTYTLTGQFAQPMSGTVEAVKVSRLQALLSELTATVRYAGWQRNVTAIRFGNAAASEPQEPVFTVSVDFAVEVISNA